MDTVLILSGFAFAILILILRNAGRKALYEERKRRFQAGRPKRRKKLAPKFHPNTSSGRKPTTTYKRPKPPHINLSQPLIGKCHVIDGDTIVINRVHIRLFGIDAPELDHPYGNKAKWAMIHLCKGQTIRAVPTGAARIDAYERMVATCFLPDGRDLSAELVKQGLALDWPKYSDGVYRQYEPQGVRKKLWRANVRQGPRP